MVSYLVSDVLFSLCIEVVAFDYYYFFFYLRKDAFYRVMWKAVHRSCGVLLSPLDGSGTLNMPFLDSVIKLMLTAHLLVEMSFLDGVVSDWPSEFLEGPSLWLQS